MKGTAYWFWNTLGHSNYVGLFIEFGVSCMHLCHNACAFDITMPVILFTDVSVSNVVLGQVSSY